MKVVFDDEGNAERVERGSEGGSGIIGSSGNIGNNGNNGNNGNIGIINSTTNIANSSKKRHRKMPLTGDYKPCPQALEYLQAFGTPKWKFNKRWQVWLLRNMYKITPDEFRMLMNYMKGMGERAKEETREQARGMMEMDGVYYKRAKKILRYI